VALSDDQKALLRLLAQREEGYEDIAALLGLSVAEVRARVKGALAELEDSAPERAQAPSPPAPPPPRAEPRRQEPAPTRQPEPEPVTQGRAERQRTRPALRLPSFPRQRGRLIELVGGLLVILLLVLFATGAVDIGGDDNGSDGAESTSAAERKITQAVLTPPEGGDAVGRAIFGRVGKGPVLQVVAEGLEPTSKGESYTVWLYRSPKLVLRLGSIPVGKSGGLAAQLPLPVELFGYLARGAFDQIYISLTESSEYAAEVALAKRQKRLPAYTGTTVLRGEIVGPLVRG
jgi:hypothetical protein